MSETENGAIIEARGLTKRYLSGEVTVRALQGIDFLVRRGEIVAVMGPSGCGKSTLLHLIGGLAKTDEGSLRVAGLELTEASDRQIVRHRRENIGFVFQRFNLLPTLTVKGNLQIALRICADGHASGGKISRVLDLLGIADKAARRPRQLSQGEQQRVAIARAIIHSPPLILADEPTGNLDSENTDNILREFIRLRDSLGITVVVATHNPAVASIADRCFKLRDGRVEEILRGADLGR